MSEQTSPTLVPGRSYVSVVAPVPVELCQKITAWNSQFGEETATIGNHITVLISEVQGGFEAARKLGHKPLAIERFTVELAAPLSFAPATPVTYFPLKQGATELAHAHQVLQAELGESASPFEYVPHLTLSHRLTEDQLVQAQEFYNSIPREMRSFTVDLMRVYSNIEGDWNLLTEIDLS